MSTRLVLSSLVAIAIAGGCRNPTNPDAPAPWHPDIITNIRVPSQATIADTFTVRFTYLAAACEDLASFEARHGAGVVLFTVSSASTKSGCVAKGGNVTHEIAYVVAPPQTAPLYLRFTEPGAPDSVRVVAQ